MITNINGRVFKLRKVERTIASMHCKKCHQIKKSIHKVFMPDQYLLA